MAFIRFSHILLIVALGTWILAFIINLFFPAFLYSVSKAPAFLIHSSTAVRFLLSLLSSMENNTLAMLCFLTAMACTFVAGAVYGMEREAERYALINDEHREGADGDGSKNDTDLEKGVWEHAEYCEKDAYPYFANRPFPLPPVDAYTNVRPAPASPADASPPTGDAMTGEYYLSTAEANDIAAQTQAQRKMLARPQVDGKSSLELYLSARLPKLPIASFASRKLSQENERLDELVEEERRGGKESAMEGVTLGS